MILYLVPECLRQERNGDAAFSDNLGPEIFDTRLEWILQRLEARVDLVILARPRHQQRADQHQIVHPQLPVRLVVVEDGVDLAHLVLQRPPGEDGHLLDILKC